MPTDQEYRQLREEREAEESGKTDRCCYCPRTGIIGEEFHVLLRVTLGVGQTFTSFLAAHDKCVEEERARLSGLSS